MILNGHDHDDASMNGFTRTGVPAASLEQPEPTAEPDLMAQCVELERQLEAVLAEVTALRIRAAERDASLKAALREELVASRDRLTTMEAEHQRTVDGIRADAERQVEQIIADAQRDVGEWS